MYHWQSAHFRLRPAASDTPLQAVVNAHSRSNLVFEIVSHWHSLQPIYGSVQLPFILHEFQEFRLAAPVDGWRRWPSAHPQHDLRTMSNSAHHTLPRWV